MGQFTVADSAGLVAFGTALGVLGGLLFLALRSLRIGPGWFRVASMTVGPAVVVGSMLVHDEGIDFRVLEPVWLAVALFVALPATFALSVSWLTDRWTRAGAWAWRPRRTWVLGLVPLVLTVPVAPVVVGAFGARALHQSSPAVRRVVSTPTFASAVRAALALVFLAALTELVLTIRALT